MTMSDRLSQSCACPQKQRWTFIRNSVRNCRPVEEGPQREQYELYADPGFCKAPPICTTCNHRCMLHHPNASQIFIYDWRGSTLEEWWQVRGKADQVNHHREWSTWAAQVPSSPAEIARKSAQLIILLIKTIGHLWLSLTSGDCICCDNAIKSGRPFTAFLWWHESLMRTKLAPVFCLLQLGLPSLLPFYCWQLTYLKLWLSKFSSVWNFMPSFFSTILTLNGNYEGQSKLLWNTL